MITELSVLSATHVAHVKSCHDSEHLTIETKTVAHHCVCFLQCNVSGACHCDPEHDHHDKGNPVEISHLRHRTGTGSSNDRTIYDAKRHTYMLIHYSIQYIHHPYVIGLSLRYHSGAIVYCSLTLPK